MNYLCPKEVAGILGLAERTARRLMASQEIESFRLGKRHWRTTPTRIMEFAEKQFDRYRRPTPQLRVMPSHASTLQERRASVARHAPITAEQPA